MSHGCYVIEEGYKEFMTKNQLKHEWKTEKRCLDPKLAHYNDLKVSADIL